MTEPLLRYFASLRLTLPLLFGLALGAVAGTVIPQNLSAADYERLYSPSLTAILKTLQLFDVYRSWWFIALLGLLALNLTLCSWQRLPSVWNSLRRMPSSAPPGQPGKQFVQTFSIPGEPPEVASAAVGAFLKKRFASARRSGHGETLSLAAQRGAWTRLAVFAIHGAILLVLAGGVIGVLWGFQGYAVIAEGETVHELVSRRGDQPIPLAFGLRCDAFSVTFHDDGRRPKEFKSMVSILEKGEPVLERRPITVNAPLSFAGINFYQSDYGPAAPPRVSLRVQPPLPAAPFEVILSPGETAPLPPGGKLRLLRFAASYRDLGPTALVEVVAPGGESYSLPVFQNRPDLDDAHRSGYYHIRFNRFEQPYYTVLMASYDPGLGLVWSGFILLAAGLTMTLLFSPRRLWVTISPDADRLNITVTGEWRRNTAAATAFFGHLAQELETELGKRE
ncbi:MAG: cytochrome c biogenesis protein ResB [Desulfuromonadaceae bacterium]|nr:cytochrome c biogenesis protein ResB [Desulfuromonadaceae bacterium]